MRALVLISGIFALAFCQIGPGKAFAEGADADTSMMKDVILLSVDKSALTAELRTLPEGPTEPKSLRSFKIAIGKAEGDKERQGDNKTPEGIYFTTGTINGKQLTAAKYGPVAIPLNFPNPIDQLQGKTGYGIWLHGVGERRIEDAKVTEGCIAFMNNEITSLINWLRPNHGVVVIAKSAAEVNQPDDVSHVLSASQDWVDAWGKRDMDRYINHYADDFDNNGKNRDAYRAYKTAVFKSYKNMNVTMKNMRIVTHPKYAVVMMNQDFSGDNRFRSDGRKMLYMRREGGNWKIVRELFDNFMMNPVKYSNDDLVGLRQGASASATSETAGTRSL